MTQLEYANSINATRSTLNNWESGAYRLSVTGALGIHRQHGVSLDFLFAGDVEALSKTLRMEWIARDKEIAL